jgi:flagellar biosynthesis/type III secretory pathway chaperone
MPIYRRETGKEQIMSTATDDLVDILEHQIQNYNDLKKLVLEKRKAIIANDLKELAAVTSRIQHLIASNNQLEAQRTDVVKTVATELNIPESKITLTRLAGYYEPPVSDKLRELRHRTVSAIKDVQRQNRINAEMLKYCSNLMDSVLRRIVDGEACEPTYGSTGKTTRKPASASLLDRHI